MIKKEGFTQYEFPQSLKKTLKKGEYAVYQLTDVYYKNGKFSGRTAGIPNKDIVYDGDGNLTPIAYVQGYTSDGYPNLGNIWFTLDSECTIICMSGVKHANLYNFLEVSNYNESNPNRDQNIQSMYRRVDSMNNAKQTREQRASRVEALKAVMSMSNEDIDQFIKNNSNISFKVVSTPNGERDWDALRDSLERYAEQNPDKFLSLSKEKKSSSDTEIEQIIKFGMENDIIGFDVETKSWYGANGKPFLTVKSAKDNNQVKDLIAYFKTPTGNKVYMKIRDAKG
jgi:hypothetical protein